MNEFPKLKQPDGSISCGAYSVVASLCALGIIPLREPQKLRKFDLETMCFSGDEVQLEQNDTLDVLANKIYLVTGIVSEDDTTKFISESGLNSVAAMAYVFHRFGLKTDVIVRDESTYKALSQQYPLELQQLKSLCIPIIISNKSPLVDDNSVLIPSVVAEYGLHCVATNSDGIWFDPDNGANSLTWGCITEWGATQHKSTGYEWLGVALRGLEEKHT